MPETISEHLARSGFGLNESQYNPRIRFGAEWGWFPIYLLALFPGNNIKMSIILVGKDEACEIVIVVIIDVESSFEVDATQHVRSFINRQDDEKDIVYYKKIN